jgi:hypothetical protein
MGHKQSSHPERVTEESVYQVMVVLGKTTTPAGPDVPSYLTPSIIM